MPASLRLTGYVEQDIVLGFDDLAGMRHGQVPDVSQLDPSRTGSAVRLEALLSRVRIRTGASQLTVRSLDGFEARVPLDAVRERALLIYGLENQPLPKAFGGPIRLLIPNAAACGEAAVDTCANVKNVVALEIS